MHFENQRIIPAVKHMKDFEQLLTRDFTYIVLLESHLTQLPSLIRTAKQHNKKLILHADLIQGLKHDESAAQFLCQMLKPAGLISTHSSVITTAKKNRVLAIQRIFLIDSQSLDTSYRVLTNSKPDYIEVLPGVLPDIIREVRRATQLPILAGGFIRSRSDIQSVLDAGAAGVTTSHKDLWSVKIDG
ncbi:glycerol-3-phosphate responsive antiterminator [Alicyclobacillus acidoterrestris]|uniref:glycerol-3-phosphate responsive antiterminator n=1 Tax=Alicyclobacillus TaxID=29330 RepID=UPI001A8D04AF|nr:glycerol-3-phosphate responsive antiterminator [Alicyclobacillus suci]